MPRSNIAWTAIFSNYFSKHDFNKEPAILTAEMIKNVTHKFKKTSEREVRILAKMDSREEVPKILKDKGLFVLPIKNGKYAITKGEGFVDIPTITSPAVEYSSKLEFPLDTSVVGNSEMQHLDYAYAVSVIRTFIDDPTLVLTIRGRKRTPKFEFNVRKFSLEVEGVQTEVDAGYEGKDKVVLLEAKNSETTNTIIRQLYYPFRKWKLATNKKVLNVFFEKRGSIYSLWQFEFIDPDNYNSIKLVKSARYKIV